MNLLPHPTELDAPVGAESCIEEHRNLYCSHYSRCLNTVVKMGWDGWTCMKCPLYATEGLKPDLRDFANDRRGEGGSAIL